MAQDGETFRFVTRQGIELILESTSSSAGLTLGWTDQINSGVGEHLILQRRGALHEITHTPPRQFSFRCILPGPDVTARYQRLVAALQSSPEGDLDHPRLGRMSAIWKGIQAQESPGQQIDLIEYTITFTESGLRDFDAVSAPAAAQQAQAQAATLQQQASSSPLAVRAQAQAVVAAVIDFAAQVQLGAAGIATTQDIEIGQRAVEGAVAQLLALSVPYPLRAQSALVLSAVEQARSFLISARPTTIWHEVRSEVTLSALCARLYGGRFAQAMASEIRRQNHMTGATLTAGSRIVIPDPQSVRGDV